MFPIDPQASVREKFRVQVRAQPWCSGELTKRHEQRNKPDIKDSFSNASHKDIAEEGFLNCNVNVLAMQYWYYR